MHSIPTHNGKVSPIAAAGVLIRYGFYLVGVVVLGMIGIGILGLMSYRVQSSSGPVAFRLSGGEFDAAPSRTQVLTSAAIGRMDIRSYGRITNHDRDFTAMLVVPPNGETQGSDFLREMRTMPGLRETRWALSSRYHDLHTRFGAIRAAEFYVDVEGRRKLCLAYLSRFDTDAFYLKGWTCEASGAKPSPSALACTLNRLTLDTPLANKEADAFFRERQARSSACYSDPVTQTTDTRRPRSPRRL